MKNIFNKYLWNAPLYKTHEDIVKAMADLQITGKAIKHVHAIGTAQNMETWRCIRQMRGILFEHAGIPYEDIDSGTYPYCDNVQFPCEVEICEPVVFVFEDDSTLEILPHGTKGLQMSVGQIGADVVDGLNQSNFDSGRLFERLRGHAIRDLQTIVQTRESKCGKSIGKQKSQNITYQFSLDGKTGFFFRQTYEGWYFFGLTRQNRWTDLRCETASVSYRDWEAVRHGLTQITIVEGHDGGGYFRVVPVRAERITKYRFDAYYEEQISIREDDVIEFLYFFLEKEYDAELNRICLAEYEGEQFDWYGYNFFTYESIAKMLNEIDRYADMIENDFHNPLLDGLKKKFYPASFDQDYNYIAVADRLPAEVVIESNRNVAVSFYRRFTARMRAMMEYSPQYKLISFEGP